MYLDEGPLCQLLVYLRLVHDVLGSVGVLQGAQRLLQTAQRQPNDLNMTHE